MVPQTDLQRIGESLFRQKNFELGIYIQMKGHVYNHILEAAPILGFDLIQL